jgi:pimeloyl-ACP methyl ester carboxylesterase
MSAPFNMGFLSVMGLISVALFALAALLWTPDKSRDALEAEYAKPPSTFVTVAGLRLHLRDTGDKSAPALILLHGFGSSLHTWDGWSAQLQKQYRVVRIDLPGAGLTGPDTSSATGDYSDARSFVVLQALMDQLGVVKASFIGNSVGGRIAWGFAAKHPDLVSKLVLVAPDGFASPGFEYGKAPNVPAVLGLMRYTLPKALLKKNLEPAYGDAKNLSDEIVNRYYDMMLVPGARDAMLERMRQIMLSDPTPALKTITAPTLLLWGSKDAMIPMSNAQDYLRALPKSRLVSLDGVGHVPHEESPAISLLAVEAFLRE